MIYIKKGSAPGLFIQYTKIRGARFDDMPTKTKDELRTSLLKEQGYLCAYCMKRLKDSHKEVKIEHYEPRNNDNELDYKNLLAVCYGGEGAKPEFQTCDTKKGNNDEIEINPQNQQQMARISYRNDGLICIDDEKLQSDLDLVLNLNMEQLKAVRKAALEALQANVIKKFGKKSLSKEYWEKQLSKYQTKDNGKLQGYCGILIWYLKKKVRQHS